MTELVKYTFIFYIFLNYICRIRLYVGCEFEYLIVNGMALRTTTTGFMLFLP